MEVEILKTIIVEWIYALWGFNVSPLWCKLPVQCMIYDLFPSIFWMSDYDRDGQNKNEPKHS